MQAWCALAHSHTWDRPPTWPLQNNVIPTDQLPVGYKSSPLPLDKQHTHPDSADWPQVSHKVAPLWCYNIVPLRVLWRYLEESGCVHTYYQCKWLARDEGAMSTLVGRQTVWYEHCSVQVHQSGNSKVAHLNCNCQHLNGPLFVLTCFVFLTGVGNSKQFSLRVRDSAAKNFTVSIRFNLITF